MEKVCSSFIYLLPLIVVADAAFRIRAFNLDYIINSVFSVPVVRVLEDEKLIL